MKKALVMLGAAALALVLFAGCQQEVLDANIKDMPSGDGNYNFEDKTFSWSEVDTYIQATTTSTVGTTTTTTRTRTPIIVDTYTITFNDDNTFSTSYVQSYAAGANGTYTDTATTTYTYGGGMGGSASGHSWTGFAGQVIFSDTRTGTWDTFTEKTDGTTTYTKEYLFAFASRTQVTNTDNAASAATAVYALASSTNSTTPYVDANDQMEYTYYGKDADDNVMYYISFSNGYGWDGMYTRVAD